MKTLPSLLLVCAFPPGKPRMRRCGRYARGGKSLRGKPEVVKIKGGEPLQAGILNRLLRAGLAVDDHGDSEHLGAFSAQHLDGLEGRLAGGGSVFEHDDALTRDIGPLNLPATAMIFGLFTHHEGVHGRAGGYRGVQHGVGDGVGAECQATDGLGTQAGDKLPHNAADGGRGAVVQGQATHVDVVRGLLTR